MKISPGQGFFFAIVAFIQQQKIIIKNRYFYILKQQYLTKTLCLLHKYNIEALSRL